MAKQLLCWNIEGGGEGEEEECDSEGPNSCTTEREKQGKKLVASMFRVTYSLCYYCTIIAQVSGANEVVSICGSGMRQKFTTHLLNGYQRSRHLQI